MFPGIELCVIVMIDVMHFLISRCDNVIDVTYILMQLM